MTDLKDFVDPFEGQLGYDTTTHPGAVMNVDKTHTFYKNGQKVVRSKLVHVSTWNGKNIWDGIGPDPYQMMGKPFKIVLFLHFLNKMISTSPKLKG